MSNDIPLDTGAPPCVSCGAHGRKQDSQGVCLPCLRAHLGMPPHFRLKQFVAPSQFFKQPAGYLFEFIGFPLDALATTPITMPYVQISHPLMPTSPLLGLWLQRVFPDDCPAYGEIRWHPNFQALTLPDVPNGRVEHAVKWPRGIKARLDSVKQALAGLDALTMATAKGGRPTTYESWDELLNDILTVCKEKRLVKPTQEAFCAEWGSEVRNLRHHLQNFEKTWVGDVRPILRQSIRR